ncbi:hypothetical protein C8R43DRAFT_1168108 [Mycena crocata]|nr:hypothetical protein C8R43DRAFT_1168108 [Mycena crocata]
MHRIPNETLCIIFLSIGPDLATLTFRPESETSGEEPVPALLLLTKVCRRWAQVATSLWKKCDLTFNSNATEYMRTIQQVTTLLKWREADRLDFRIEIHYYEGWRDVLVSFIALHALKFRALALSVPYELVALLHMMSPAFITLESFALLVQSNNCPGNAWIGKEQWTGLHNHKRTSTLLQNAPYLRRLQVGSWRNPIIPLLFRDLATFPLGQLTTLCMCESDIDCNECLEILANCPLLEECSICTVMGSPNHESTRVLLNYLRKLHILGLSGPGDSKFWDRIATPQLIDLSVAHGNTSTPVANCESATALISLQRRCGFELRRLELGNVPLPVVLGDMQEFLVEFHALEDLSLRWDRGEADLELMKSTVARALSVSSTTTLLKNFPVSTKEDNVTLVHWGSSQNDQSKVRRCWPDIPLGFDDGEPFEADGCRMDEYGMGLHSASLPLMLFLIDGTCQSARSGRRSLPKGVLSGFMAGSSYFEVAGLKSKNENRTQWNGAGSIENERKRRLSEKNVPSSRSPPSKCSRFLKFDELNGKKNTATLGIHDLFGALRLRPFRYTYSSVKKIQLVGKHRPLGVFRKTRGQKSRDPKIEREIERHWVIQSVAVPQLFAPSSSSKWRHPEIHSAIHLGQHPKAFT